MGDEEFLGGEGKTLMPGSGLEGPERIERRETASHESCNFSLQAA
jgi:hypothetical protein